MNQASFFNSIRANIFGGHLSQTQVDGINALLDAWANHGGTDLRALAYVLGTVYHEAGSGFKPVREGFAKSTDEAIQHVTALFDAHKIKTNYALPADNGQSYFGRGFVQITWKGNYEAFQTILKIPLVANPDLALQTQVSAEIAIIGMMRGVFTGKKLTDYFNDHEADYVNARRIINGMDQASLIANYAQNFYTALTAA